jgi:hypothetical protein
MPLRGSMLTTTVDAELLLRALVIQGRVNAKQPGPINKTAARPLLPQPVVLEMLHSIVFSQLCNPVLEFARMHHLENVILGAFTGHQGMEVVYALQLVVEIGLDRRSQFSVCSSDVKSTTSGLICC